MSVSVKSKLRSWYRSCLKVFGGAVWAPSDYCVNPSCIVLELRLGYDNDICINFFFRLDLHIMWLAGYVNYQNAIVATLSSILDSQLSRESGKFQLARWSHYVALISTMKPPTHLHPIFFLLKGRNLQVPKLRLCPVCNWSVALGCLVSVWKVSIGYP